MPPRSTCAYCFLTVSVSLSCPHGQLSLTLPSLDWGTYLCCHGPVGFLFTGLRLTTRDPVPVCQPPEGHPGHVLLTDHLQNSERWLALSEDVLMTGEPGRDEGLVFGSELRSEQTKKTVFERRSF